MNSIWAVLLFYASIGYAILIYDCVYNQEMLYGVVKEAVIWFCY